MRLPESDRVSHTREKMIADLTVAMGGRAAEELIFGYNKVTSGASSDIKQATDLAKSMVIKWGMSDKVGPLYHSDEKSDSISTNLANLIDEEVKLIVTSALDRAKNLLNEHLESLHIVAKNLLDFETLTGENIKDIINGKELIKDSTDNEQPIRRSFTSKVQ